MSVQKNKPDAIEVAAGLDTSINNFCTIKYTRLQFNYNFLIWFIAELAHVANEERSASLLGECALNLPPEALYDIRFILLEMRADAQVRKAAA